MVADLPAESARDLADGPCRRLLAGCALLILCAVGCGFEDIGDDPEEEDVFLADRVLNIAHRGGTRMAPESTLEAYRSAVDVGADVLEMDLHATADGVVVCMHDNRVDRTTDGTGLITGMSFEDIRKLDAGYWFTSDGGASYPYRNQGVVVPSFREVLTAFPDLHFVAEIKQFSPPILADVLDILEETGMTGRIILASMSDDALAEIRTRSPEVYTSFGTAEMIALVGLTREDEQGYRPPAPFVHPPHEYVDAEFSERARRFGLRVHSWTVNDAEEMDRLIRLGTDGIMTDDPQHLAGRIDELAPAEAG